VEMSSSHQLPFLARDRRDDRNQATVPSQLACRGG
jgi:hypothetical protein